MVKLLLDAIGSAEEQAEEPILLIGVVQLICEDAKGETHLFTHTVSMDRP